MSAERLSLDANILFYTIDADAGELQERAREIVRRAALGDCFLTLQTLCEFFASTTRSCRKPGACYVFEYLIG
jgi:predicted nucleic acid-binding protein